MPRFQYFRIAAISTLLFAGATLQAAAQDLPTGRAADVTDRGDQGPFTQPENSKDAAKETAKETAKDSRDKDSKDTDKPATKTAAKPKKPFGGGTPIDVIIHNKLWEDPPEPKDFVRENRRPVDELTYQPTIGFDPERPKTRSKDELGDLKSELEKAAEHNVQAEKGKVTKKASKTPHKKTADKTGKSDKTDKTDKTN